MRKELRRLTGFLAAAVMVFSCAAAEPMPARDAVMRTPNENSITLCDHDFCYWQLTQGETDEALVWQVLTQPMTVLKGKQELGLSLCYLNRSYLTAEMKKLVSIAQEMNSEFSSGQ